MARHELLASFTDGSDHVTGLSKKKKKVEIRVICDPRSDTAYTWCVTPPVHTPQNGDSVQSDLQSFIVV